MKNIYTELNLCLIKYKPVNGRYLMTHEFSNFPLLWEMILEAKKQS